MASSLSCSAVLCLALAISHVASQIIIPSSDLNLDADNNINGQCNDKPIDGSRIILNDQAGVARICHGRGLSSVLRLQCDFNTGSFNLFVNGSGWVFDQELKLTEPRHTKQMIPLTGNKGQCEYPKADNEKLIESYTYFNDAGTAGWSMTLPNTTMVIREGRLYYETDIYLDQVIAAADCVTGVQQSHNVHLSCCANPLTTDDVRVIPPSHEHCLVDACKQNPRFGCQCVKTENSFLIHVETRDPAVSETGTGVDIVDLKLYPGFYETSAEAGSNVVNITPSGPSTLDPVECPVSHIPFGLTAVKEVAINTFQFEDKEDEPLRVECKVRYCNHGRSQDGSGKDLLPCRPEPQMPRSPTCPSTYGIFSSSLE